MSLILFFKAEQFDLFAAPVQVKAGVRDGKTVKPYVRVQKIHAEGPHGPMSLRRERLIALHQPGGDIAKFDESTAAKHPVFGEYSFKKPLHAAVGANGGVLHWSTSRKDVEKRRDKMTAVENPAWANAKIEKVTADTAHKYTEHAPDNRAPADPDHAAMQRYGQGVRAEEARVLKSPEHKAMVAQSEAEVAKRRADREAKDAQPINPAAPAGRMPVSKLALEVWRASGKRTLSRLDTLVDHYATTLGESGNRAMFTADARRAARDWEVEAEEAPAAPPKMAVFLKKKPPKEPGAMTASEINKALDRLDAESSKISQDMIDAGRGHELPTETHKLSDPLAMRMRENWERSSPLRREVERRYGPGSTGRLPVRVSRKKKVALTVPRIGEKLSRYSGGHRAPSVDWETPDLQDSGKGKRVTAESILKDYGPKSGKAIAYPAYVPMSDIPSPVLVEEEDANNEEEYGGNSYDWSEYNPRNTFPPVKLEVTKEGKIQIIDGNHRLRFFDERNFTHAPAWVIDHRRNVADEAADEDDEDE